MSQQILLNIFSKKINIEKGLYIIATPIGNISDITIRAIKTLDISNAIICEDTRVTKKLFTHLGLKINNKKWLTYNDHSNKKKLTAIVSELNKNKIISFVSDAGTPLISDPGYKLINFIRKNKCNVFSLPGPCSAIACISLSGLKTDKFCFLGFLPKNKNNYIATLRNYAQLNYSIIIYEKPSKLNFFLNTIKKQFKNFKLAIIKEITKMYEEIFFITQDNIEDFIENNKTLKGELTIVAELYITTKKIYTDKEIIKELNKLKPSQVSAMLSKNSSQSREILYKRCMGLLNDKFFKK